MTIPCRFFLRSERFARSLRVFSHEDDCPAGSYCQAFVPLDQIPGVLDKDGCIPSFDPLPAEDPRWPSCCRDCKRPFPPERTYQMWVEWVYEDALDGTEAAVRTMPVGALWFQRNGCGEGSIHFNARQGDVAAFEWLGSEFLGQHLHCQTPGGVWDLDSIATNGPGWKWEGNSLPEITATPSIHFPGKYHGWLRNGALIEC